MTRSCWTLLVVIGTVAPAAAQEPEIPVRKLTVSPAAAPDRALRYHLLPELRDTTPGNAVLLYYRAFSPEWSSNLHGNQELQKKIEEALDKSPAEVKAMPEIDFVRHSHMLKEVDRAARRAYCDWELTPRLREDGVNLLIPDVQEMRQFARYLKLRAKLELADRDFDKAAYTLQTGFQMGRHVAEGPTLIQALVGAAITATMLTEVGEWVEAPGSPNLYWALGLPQPFVDLRTPLQGERIWLDNLLPGYREALADPAKVPPPFTPDLRKRLGQVIEGNGVTTYLLMLTTKKYSLAKAYLREHGRTAEQVEALPVTTAVMLYELAVYDRLYDEMLKWQGWPYWIARPGLDRAEQALREEVVRSGSPGFSLAGYLMPAILKVQFASVRTDRTINQLRTVEALRMYAAAHGRFPEKLTDITDVPLPPDPVTGQPFEYKLDGETAVLTAPPPAGERPYVGNSQRYEITLRK
ncbi:MAG TPA: hypothetical protein VGF55_29465 [Gemmataceae bacterium]|jgi:hypothetical protein